MPRLIGGNGELPERLDIMNHKDLGVSRQEQRPHRPEASLCGHCFGVDGMDLVATFCNHIPGVTYRENAL